MGAQLTADSDYGQDWVGWRWPSRAGKGRQAAALAPGAVFMPRASSYELNSPNHGFQFKLSVLHETLPQQYSDVLQPLLAVVGALVMRVVERHLLFYVSR